MNDNSTKLQDSTQPPLLQNGCYVQPFTLFNENCLDTMAKMPDNFIDLTVTSPPYDDLRTYNGYCFDFENVAKQLFRVTKQGGVVVWNVNDKKDKGTKTLTSFKQALFFKEIGFFVHDVMIWEKCTFSSPIPNMYHNVFEYMFILSKGKPKTFNPIIDKQNKKAGAKTTTTFRESNGETTKRSEKLINDFGKRHNIWKINEVKNNTNGKHPAPFPEQLANDHIISWSNENELIYDPFGGSGTTAKMALINKRKCIMSEISAKYCEIISQRVKPILDAPSLF
jgi:DNA modification methylase